MDPSSPYAMRSLIDLKDRFQLAFACDTDADRHGDRHPQRGLASSQSLPRRCPSTTSISTVRIGARRWAVGKTVVSSRMIDLVTQRMGRTLYEVPVGFQVVRGRPAGRFAWLRGRGERGVPSFARVDGSVWTTDKDGIVAGAARRRDRGTHRARSGRHLSGTDGRVRASRRTTALRPRPRSEQKAMLSRLSPEQVGTKELAGEPITTILTQGAR